MTHFFWSDGPPKAGDSVTIVFSTPIPLAVSPTGGSDSHDSASASETNPDGVSTVSVATGRPDERVQVSSASVAAPMKDALLHGELLVSLAPVTAASGASTALPPFQVLAPFDNAFATGNLAVLAKAHMQLHGERTPLGLKAIKMQVTGSQSDWLVISGLGLE